MSREDRERWDAKHRDAAAADDPPSTFLVEHANILPAGRTLDLAAGSGRNAAFLARRGHAVIAVDVSWQGLVRVRQRARGIACVQMDLDAPAVDLPAVARGFGVAARLVSEPGELREALAERSDEPRLLDVLVE